MVNSLEKVRKSARKSRNARQNPIEVREQSEMNENSGNSNSKTGNNVCLGNSENRFLYER
jgi:hypothetical protein